ncbi:MAG: hypothetical protein J0I19_14720 [Alphaproteobacteria bacterium]|nr:hypothetical protein [Alphaproteobacteria bacterium]
MQISAQTLLASQQTFASQPAAVQPRPAPGFSAALEKAGGFEPLPLKQAAPVPEPAPAQPMPGTPARLGAMIDIRV